MSVSQSNKRIAKNTLFLYFRQLVTMAVSLYTVRVVLEVLGAEDYGIYNVVGGVVVLFSFLRDTMGSATQRFLSFEMGKGKDGFPAKVFSLSVRIYLILAGIILLLSETAGLWFVNQKLTIPAARMEAANLVYQSSILSFTVTLLCIPYNASIVAMERMKVFAYAGLMEAVLRLLAVLVLPLLPWDNLAAYAVLSFITASSVQIYYVWYGRRQFLFCRCTSCTGASPQFRSMLSFAGWNMTGTLANILRGQGLNILVNLFFTPVVNAAFSIAMQVSHAATNLTFNFFTAVRPQLVKLYATGRREEMFKLGYRTCRFAFYLILIVSVPLLLDTEEMLSVWLAEVPPRTPLFVRLIVLAVLIDVPFGPLTHMMQACGKIMAYQLAGTLSLLLNIPVAYMFFRCGAAPETSLWVNVSLVSLSMFPKLYICRSVLGLPVREYLREVFARAFAASALIFLLLVLFRLVAPTASIWVSIAVQIAASCLIIFAIGLDRDERILVIRQVKKVASSIILRKT